MVGRERGFEVLVWKYDKLSRATEWMMERGGQRILSLKRRLVRVCFLHSNFNVWQVDTIGDLGLQWVVFLPKPAVAPRYRIVFRVVGCETWWIWFVQGYYWSKVLLMWWSYRDRFNPISTCKRLVFRSLWVWKNVLILKWTFFRMEIHFEEQGWQTVGYD